MVMAAATLLLTSLPGQTAGTAWVRRAPTVNGVVEGSIQQMTAESITLNGGAAVAGSLYVPGSPTVQLNGNPTYGGMLDGTGAATPASHKITLNGGAALGHVVRRTDAVVLPIVVAPPQPAGTRSVSLNNTSQSPGDFATLKNLTLNGNTGAVVIPPGTYGDFTANGSSSFTLGVAGTTVPVSYNFQNLTLNGSSRVDVVGPVAITLANGVTANGDLGNSAQPAWLTLNFASGGLTLNENAAVYGYVTALSATGTVTLNGNSQLLGGLVADRLTLNGNGLLRLLVPPTAFTDADHDGMDDAWEAAHGLNPLIDDSNYDNDRDGVPNIVEFRLGLIPNNPDGDGDGLYDGDEIALGLDPKVSSPDTQPPTVPAGLTKDAVTTDSVTLSWQPATDDLKVSGYIVYRDGQPIDTPQPVREANFTDTNLPDGEEFTYQVRAFDFAGNLSPPGQEIAVTTVAQDTDNDGIPDEWKNKYFGEEDALPTADPDGDGRTNLQEFQAGSNPTDFYNGVAPLTEALNAAGEGPNGEVAVLVREPGGTPWANAPYNFDSSSSRRKIAPSPAGPFEVYQLKVRTGANGVARGYLEPLLP